MKSPAFKFVTCLLQRHYLPIRLIPTQQKEYYFLIKPIHFLRRSFNRVWNLSPFCCPLVLENSRNYGGVCVRICLVSPPYFFSLLFFCVYPWKAAWIAARRQQRRGGGRNVACFDWELPWGISWLCLRLGLFSIPSLARSFEVFH